MSSSAFHRPVCKQTAIRSPANSSSRSAATRSIRYIDELGTTVGEALLATHASFLPQIGPLLDSGVDQRPRPHHRRRLPRKHPAHPARRRLGRNKPRHLARTADLRHDAAARKCLGTGDVPDVQYGDRDGGGLFKRQWGTDTRPGGRGL